MLKKILAALLALTLIITSAACTAPVANNDASPTGTPAVDSPSAAQETAAGVETLTIAITKDENSLSPFTYVSSTGTIVNRLIYDTLFTTNLENEVVPWMVKDDYKVLNDFKTYTFTLEEGQKFHNGSPVTAEDIKFSFTYPAGQNVASQRKVCDQIESIDIDGDTITINLIDSDINFLRSGLAAMRIISKAQYEGEEDGSLVTDTIGSGMYKLSEYKIGEYYRLQAVEGYFKGDPAVKNINMPIIEDATVVQQGILSGELAASTSSVNVEMLEVFEQTDSIEVLASPGYSPMIMNINNGRAPMDSKEFRAALTYAIDVSGIMRSLYGQYATVGTKGVIRPDMPYSKAGLEYEYNIEKANAILDEAGFNREGDGIRVTPQGQPCSFEILAYSTNAVRIRAAELISAQLKQAGIELTVKAMEMDTVDAFVWPDFEVSKGRDYDFSMWGWGSSINPDFIPGLFSSDYSIGTSNVCGYKNAEFDASIAGAYNNIRTAEELKEVLIELQGIIAEDPGLICLGFADSLQACNTGQYSGFKAGKGANVINIYTFLGE
ncbi:MAG: ABC transporter substrate-binding protein [Christensenellales bacterium]|jgi:peptide/nickel transport system substrate-binding protein